MTHPDIFTIVRVMGRPRETRCTLNSLALTRGIERLNVNILYAGPFDGEIKPEPRGLAFLDMKGYQRVFDEPMDVDQLIADSGLKNVTVIEEQHLVGGAQPMGLAFRMYQHVAALYPWYLWVEGDILFNPSWLEQTLAMYEEAKPHFKVGIMQPCRLTARHYHDVDPGEQFSFWTRHAQPGPCWLMPREAVGVLDLKKKNWYIGRSSDLESSAKMTTSGFTNLCPKKSVVQHIGRKGGYSTGEGKWLKYGRGGVGFAPEPEVEDLWREFNYDAV